jgi:EmrB/QacA subfamily drug resistance transporter
VTGPTRAGTGASPQDRALAVFCVTALGAFMASLDLSIVNIAFPAIQETFSSDARASLAWIVTGYAIAFGSLLVVAGRTADRLGARRIFFVGLAVFCAASALCGLAPTLLALDAGRIVQGCGAAMMLPASLGLLLASVPAARRTITVARWGGVGALAVATGPTLGALLVTAGGWRWVFYVNLPIGLLAWLAGRSVLPMTPRDTTRAPPDYLGALLVFASLGTLVLALTQGPAWGWSNTAVIGCLAVSVVLGVGFVWRCAHHPEPVLDLHLFRARTFSVANAAMVLYAMAFFAMLLGNILFLTSVWHYSILTAGLAVTPGPLVVAMVAGPAGRIASSVGFRRVLLAGASVLALGLALYALRVTEHPEYLSVWLPSTLLVGFGIGLTFPVLGATAVSSLPRDRFSVGSAVNQTARQVGGSIGIAMLVVILGTAVHPHLDVFTHLWWYATGMVVLSGLACLALPSGRPAPIAPSADRTDLPVTSVTAARANAHRSDP